VESNIHLIDTTPELLVGFGFKMDIGNLHGKPIPNIFLFSKVANFTEKL
jgi:hypothetical protein